MQAKLYKLRPLGKQTKTNTHRLHELKGLNSGGTFLQNQSDIYLNVGVSSVFEEEKHL